MDRGADSGGDAGVEAPVGWVRRLLSWLAPHRKNVLIAFGASLLGTGVAGFTPLVQRELIDDVVIQRRRSAAPLLALLVLAGVLRFAMAYVRRFYAGRISVDVQFDLRTALFRHLQRLDFASHDNLQTGQLVTRAGTDVNMLQGLLGFLPIVMGSLLLFVVSLTIMLTLSPLLTGVVLLIIPALTVVTLRSRRTIFPASWDASQHAGVVAGVVEEAVTGVRVVKGFGQERRELGRLATAARDLYARRLRLIRIQSRMAPTMQAIPSIGQVAVLGVGGWLTIEGDITLGTFLAFNLYVTQLIAPVRMVAMLTTLGQTSRASVERISEVFDANPVVVDRPGAGELRDPRGEVVFDDVRFGYLRDEPVLDGFSLRVAPGETVALVGTSGSGKSTVALLLPRFYDVHAGTISIGGQDITEVTTASLRAGIGVVFEDSFLFSDSITANIAYGRPDATAEEVEAAARAAEAHEFILDLPDGYATVVGEQGLTLSGGQRQRIALARALITDPQLLVLDDATSAVDSRIEEEIQATLRRLLVGRTTLLVAHRRSTLRLADRIAVVDKGRVVDVGTHEELTARCPLYTLLLSGPGDDVEGRGVEDAAAEAGAPAAPVAEPGTVDGITPSLWVREGDVSIVDAMHAAGRMPKATFAGSGPGGPPGGAFGATMPATDELLERVAALPPATEEPDTSLDEADRPDPAGFSLRRFLLRWKLQLAVGMVLVVVDAGTNLLAPYLLRFGVDEGITKRSAVPGGPLESRPSMLWLAVGLALAAALFSWANGVVQTLITGRTSERILYALRVKVFGQLQRLSLDYYDREMAGRVMTRMTTDVESLSQLFQTGLVQAIVSLITCVGVGVFLLAMSWKLALVTILGIFPPLALATVAYRRRSSLAYEAARERVAAVNANFQESLSGVRVAQAFGRERTNTNRFEGLADHYRQARVGAQRLVALYFPFVEMLSEMANALVLGTGAWLITRGSLTRGELLAFLLYLGLFFAPIQQLSAIFDTWQQARTSLRRIDELLRTPTLTPQAAEPVVPGRLRGRITFEDVAFRYPTAAPGAGNALEHCDLVIEPGETVAFVGETGAGKSTFLKLVARYYDVTAGRVLVDGTDVRDLDLTAYRQQLGVVPQEAFLFAGTIRDNIAYGRPDATDAEVEAAARAVGAHEVVATLPGGYLHVVGERGRSLSSGQRQLLALARARLVDPAILLLDEATSNLDLATEARVAAAMGAAADGRTTLVIAHRLASAAAADRVVVLDAGRVVEVGHHDELLAAGGRYAAMWRSYLGDDAPTAEEALLPTS